MRRPVRSLLLLAAGLASLLALTTPAYAQRAQNPTVINIQSDGTSKVDQDMTLQVKLTTQAGTPLADKPLDLTLPGNDHRTTTTDQNGSAEFTFRTTLAPGSYNLVVSFRGDQLNMSTSTTMPFVVIGATNTRILIEPLTQVPLGRAAVLTVHLETDQGVPLPDQRLILYVNGTISQTGATDRNGIAHLSTSRDISAGKYTLTVVYPGDSGQGPASQTVQIGINSLELMIQTVPAIQGVHFKLQDKEFVSGADGVARIKVDQPGDYNVQVLPLANSMPDIHAEFGGWGDRTTTDYNVVTIPATAPVIATFKTSFLVSQSFIDLQGNVVDPSRIQSITYKRSDGAVFTFNDNQPRWLAANYLVRRVNGIVSSPYLYSLMSVMVNGTNVVSAQQQRFHVNPNDKWILQLLLFSAHFKAHDMMFGFPLGSSIQLQYPDGFELKPVLDRNSETTVLSLPRGQYKVTVHTQYGFSPTAPLAMSRNQDVDLSIISYLDILVLALVGLVLGPGILYIGQPGFRRIVRHPTLAWQMFQGWRAGLKLPARVPSD